MKTLTKSQLRTILYRIEENGFDYWLKNEAEEDFKDTVVEEKVKLLNELSDELYSIILDCEEKSVKGTSH